MVRKSGRPPRAEGDAAQNRQLIIDTAARLIREKGTAALTVRSVCAAAAMTAARRTMCREGIIKNIRARKSSDVFYGMSLRRMAVRGIYCQVPGTVPRRYIPTSSISKMTVEWAGTDVLEVEP